MSNIPLDNKEVSSKLIVDYLHSLLTEGSPNPEWGKIAFLRSINSASRVLDLGCGNNSPKLTKDVIPECHYIGIDVDNYNQYSERFADEYMIVKPHNFRSAIELYENSIDAVISSHNVEHCEDRYGTVEALARSLKPGGKAYISFPARDSTSFPKRLGTLNYYDDEGHLSEPPDFGRIISILTANGLEILYATTRYQPPIHWILGLGNEDLSSEIGEIQDGTWCYWGFESVIWAEKVKAA